MVSLEKEITSFKKSLLEAAPIKSVPLIKKSISDKSCFIVDEFPYDSVLIKENNKSEKKIKLSLAKYIRRRLKIKQDILTDHELNILTYNFRTQQIINRSPNLMGCFVKGKDLIKIYKEGYFGTSCMTGYNSYRMQLLADNPKNISLAVLYSSICNNFGCFDDFARAIVYTADNGTKVYHSIYSYDGYSVTFEKMEAFLKKNNIRFYQHLTIKEKEELKLTLILNKKPHHNELPYMDLFFYCKKPKPFHKNNSVEFVLYATQQKHKLNIISGDGEIR